jgi:hypothetical protein
MVVERLKKLLLQARVLAFSNALRSIDSLTQLDG